MGASQQRRARRAEKRGDQQVIDPAQQAAVKNIQDSKSTDEHKNSKIHHNPSLLTPEAFINKQEHTTPPLPSDDDVTTVSNPYHMVGGIAPESLFDTPSSNATGTTPCASVRVGNAVESKIDEDDRTTHSITPSFEDTDSETLEATPAPIKSQFAAANTSFTFESSSAFPCDFGRKHALVDFPSVFEISHLQVHSEDCHKLAVKGNSIFHAIQGRISGATALASSVSDDIDLSHPDNESCCQPRMITETSPEPKAAEYLESSHNTEHVHGGSPDGSVLDLVLTLPLEQAHRSLYVMSVDKATDVLSSKLAAWAHEEAERLETEFQHFLALQKQPTCKDVQQNMALILYRHKAPSAFEPNAIRSRPVLSEQELLHHLPTKRIFFADTEGNTRVIDCRKMMYDIEVMSDTGATDFDSIASPLKMIPRSISYSESTTASTREDSDDSIEIEDLGNFVEIGATFHTQINDWNDAVSTSDSSMDFKEDEGVIDPRLVFLPAKQVEVMQLADATASYRNDPARFVQDCLEPPMSHVIGDARETPEAASPAAENLFTEGNHQEVSDELPLASSPILSLDDATYREDVSSISMESFPDFYADLPASALFEDDGGHGFGSVEATPQALPEWLAGNLEADECAVEVPQAFSSDWASELMRMTLGTESFFTFLMQLDTIEENVTTQESVVQTFLGLVDMERKKLGRNALPASYTAASVLASKIVPHTIFLGTVSLASFLADLSFDDEGRVTVEEIYHVFKTISAADLHYQAAAGTGILGALGRRLGKIFV